jgi:hypothetical protein
MWYANHRLTLGLANPDDIFKARVYIRVWRSSNPGTRVSAGYSGFGRTIVRRSARQSTAVLINFFYQKNTVSSTSRTYTLKIPFSLLAAMSGLALSPSSVST